MSSKKAILKDVEMVMDSEVDSSSGEGFCKHLFPCTLNFEIQSERHQEKLIE